MNIRDTHFLKIRFTTFALMSMVLFLNSRSPAFAQFYATTTVSISVCGNAIVESNEVCDGGFAVNDAGYGSSIATRHCNASCSGYGPYCGDNVLQSLYLEQCDDGNNTGGDRCSAVCIQESTPITTTNPPPVTTGGGGGGGDFDGTISNLVSTRVFIDGKAYPGADVNVLKDGQVVGVVRASNDASFHYEAGNVTPGPTTYGFWAKDVFGVRSIPLSTTFQVTQNAVTTVSSVFLPPTLSVEQNRVDVGTPLIAFGQSVPQVVVGNVLDAGLEASATTTSGSDGKWNAVIPTDTLENEQLHTVKVFFETFSGGTNIKSGYSQLANFYVGVKDIGKTITADINKDGKVNLIDFSILLFHWNTTDVLADLNQDNSVNLTDVSVMLFYWTG